MHAACATRRQIRLAEGSLEIASVDSTAIVIRTRVYRLLFELPLLRRLAEIGITEKVRKYMQTLRVDWGR